MPEISVIMPVYNAAPYLREAIDSILRQSFTDFEFIIINDASTDSSEKIICSYSDPRIRYYRNETNLGLIKTLNRGIDLAEGTYIARMDNDDISFPERLALQLHYLKADTQAAMVCSPIIGITPSGKERDHWPTDFNTRTPGDIRNTLPWENCIVHPTVLIRAWIIKKYRYAENQKGSEDWDLWLRMSRDGLKIIKTSEVLLFYRIHGSSMTISHNRMQSAQVKSAIVKYRFALRSLAEGRVNYLVLKTVLTIAKDLGYEMKRRRLPVIGRKIKWLSTLSLFTARKQYQELQSVLRTYEGRHYLFFPYSHLGGAEKVHGQISRAIEKEHPLVFFTGIHNKDDHRSFFGQRVRMLNIATALYHPLFSEKTRQVVIDKINSDPNAVVFGCNNAFFYEMLQLLKPDIYVADLTHDIDYDDNQFAEKNLDNYLRCNKRVFIGQKAIDRTLLFYEEHFVEDEFRDRLQLIHNCVEMPYLASHRKWQQPFTFLYVGRDTPEKRVHLLFELAKLSAQRNLPVNFHFVGPVKVPAGENYQNCRFSGQVTNLEALAAIYASAHFIGISSSSEGFPLSVMEGLESGCIPVCTSVGDIPNHITDGENGFLIHNEGQIAENFYGLLSRLTEKSEDLFRISEHCKNYAREKFSKERFVSAYRKLLKASFLE